VQSKDPNVLVCGSEARRRLEKGIVAMAIQRSVNVIVKNGKRALFFVIATLGLGLLRPDAVLAQAAYCESYARDYAARASRGGALGGAARGGIGGAIVGGIIDGGKGAGRGAGIGAIAGGVTRGVQSSAIYDEAFRDCMLRQGK
jgi:hypothetical protein